MYKYVFWDFDGTLADSYTAILKIYRKILDDHLINADMDLIKDYLIRYSSTETKKMMRDKYGILEDEFEKCYLELCCMDEYVNSINFLNNSKEAVVKLNEMGIENFVVTNRDITAKKVLINLKSDNYFKEIVYNGLNDMTKRKPDPEKALYLINKYNLNPSEILFVGDRDLDIETANNAGVDCAIYRPIEGLRLKPKFVINDFMELENIVR